jgi:hypothetical protein
LDETSEKVTKRLGVGFLVSKIQFKHFLRDLWIEIGQLLTNLNLFCTFLKIENEE